MSKSRRKVIKIEKTSDSEFIISKLLKNKPVRSPGLKLWHWNANSYSLHKKYEVQNLIVKNNMFDVFSVSETHFKNYHDSSLFDITNYKMEVKNRTHDPVRTFGGGLLVYIKDNLEYERLFDLEINELEIIWLKIKPLKCKSFILAVVYRPPHINQFSDMIVPVLEKAFDLSDDLVLMGDFNVNLSNIFAKNNVEISKCVHPKLYDLFSSYGFTQTIKEFTRVDKKSQSLIDHVYVSDQNSVRTSFVFPWSLSDHFPICLIRNYNCTPTAPSNFNKISFRRLTDAKLRMINEELRQKSYASVFSMENVNHKLTSLYDIIGTSVDNHAPICEKIVSGHQNIQFIENNPFREKRNFFKKLLKLYGPNPYHDEQYKFYRNKTLNFDRKNFKNHVSRVINEASTTHQMSKKFHFLNVLKNKSFQQFTHLKINDEISNNSVNIANHLNTYFTSIKSQFFPHQVFNFEVSASLLNYVEERVPDGQFFDIPLISLDETTKYLKNIKTDCSCMVGRCPH